MFNQPESEQSQPSPMRPPMVYVHETTAWEYKHLRQAGAPTEEALNALGAEGWELVSVVAVGDGVNVYLKRVTA